MLLGRVEPKEKYINRYRVVGVMARSSLVIYISKDSQAAAVSLGAVVGLCSVKGIKVLRYVGEGIVIGSFVSSKFLE